uniref:Neur_chan_LBD domain-containing protein n=1 Tax=Parastrongyloides trichosuri TaxID=131310 RepID=A0A0N4ZV96_PARTI
MISNNFIWIFNLFLLLLNNNTSLAHKTIVKEYGLAEKDWGNPCANDAYRLPPENFSRDMVNRLNRDVMKNEDIMNDEARLLKYILYNYDKAVRPVISATIPVKVYLGLTLTHIFNIDERNQIMEVNIWVEQFWGDERIRWDPKDFGNISKLTLPTSCVWTPDIVIINNARDFSRGFVETNLHITHRGEMQWAPPAKVHSLCKLDVRFFPFDDNICFIELGSWVYDKSQLEVLIVDRDQGKNAFAIDSFMENGEWEIVNNRTVSHVRQRNGYYSTIKFELHLRRRMLYFLYNIIAPCAMLSILTLFQFILPCESGEKITLGLTVLLAYSVFSFNIAESMPETSEAIPLIAIYLNAMMGISGLSVGFSVLVLNMQHKGAGVSEVPIWLNKLCYKFLCKILAVKFPSKDNITKTSCDSNNYRLTLATHEFDVIRTKLKNESDMERLREDWHRVSLILDRFFFFFVLILTALTSFILLIICPRYAQRAFDDV